LNFLDIGIQPLCVQHEGRQGAGHSLPADLRPAKTARRGKKRPARQPSDRTTQNNKLLIFQITNPKSAFWPKACGELAE